MLVVYSLLAVLGAAHADTAAILNLCDPADCGATTAEIEQALLAAGATSVDVTTSTLSLDNHRMVLVSPPQDNALWNEEVAQDIVDFAQSGGLLILSGEQIGFFGTANSRVDDMLRELGLGDELQTADTWDGESGCLYPTDDVNEDHPLMDGVDHIDHNWHTALTASGNDTLAWNAEGRALLAVVDNVMLTGDAGLMLTGCSDDHTEGGWEQVLANFWATADEPADDGGDDGSGDDGSGDDGSGDDGSGDDGGGSDTADPDSGDDGGSDGFGDGFGSSDDDDGGGSGGCGGCTTVADAPGVGALLLLGITALVGRRRRG